MIQVYELCRIFRKKYISSRRVKLIGHAELYKEDRSLIPLTKIPQINIGTRHQNNLNVHNHI